MMVFNTVTFLIIFVLFVFQGGLYIVGRQNPYFHRKTQLACTLITGAMLAVPGWLLYIGD